MRDKRELLKLMIDDSLSGVRVPTDGDWKQRLAEFLRQGRSVLRARPVLIGLIWGSGWELGPQTLRVTNDVVGLVAESGVPENEVADAYFMVVAFLFGFVAMETLSPDTPGFAVSVDTARRIGSASGALPPRRRSRRNGASLRARHRENRQQPFASS